MSEAQAKAFIQDLVRSWVRDMAVLRGVPATAEDNQLER
jgi:hypothetical protein